MILFMLLSHIGEYASECNEYESLKFAVNSPQNLWIDSEYVHLSHTSRQLSPMPIGIRPHI